MFRSPVLSALPMVALFLATVTSATREELIPQKFAGFHETREAEISKEPPGLGRKERFDVSREDQLLHRLSRLIKEPLPRADDNERDKPDAVKTLDQNDTNVTSRLNTDRSEMKDMMETHVTPQDDDEEKTSAVADDKRRSKFEGTKSKSKTNVVTVLPPKIFPDNNKTANVRIATPEWLAKLNMTRYATHRMGTKNATVKEKETTTDSVLVVSISSEDSPKAQSPIANSTTTMPSTTTKTDVATPSATSSSEQSEKIVNEVARGPTTSNHPTSSSPSPAEMILHEKKKPEPKSMPSGVMALMTAISFAIVVIVTYIGLLIRRRYLEWRYGNRELLVNDFDAVDINNFEL